MNTYINSSQQFRYLLRTAFPVYGRGHDAPGIACTFSAGEEATEADVLQGVFVPHDAYRSRRACLYAYQYRLVGQKAAGVAAKLAETLRQMADRVEKKEEKTAADRIAEINFADNRRRPLQEEPHFDTRPVADVDASSEAEKELLQALRSIK